MGDDATGWQQDRSWRTDGDERTIGRAFLTDGCRLEHPAYLRGSFARQSRAVAMSCAWSYQYAKLIHHCASFKRTFHCLACQR